MFDFLKKHVRKSWFEWFHTVYASIVIVSAISIAWGDPSSTKELLLLGMFLAYFVTLLFFLIIFTFKFARKARYAEATKCIHDAIHTARDAYHYLDWCHSPDREKVVFDNHRFRELMVTALTSASAAFSLVSGLKCRTTIKVLGQNDDGTLYVSTVARDTVSCGLCKKIDDAEGKQHLVSKNTDFHLISEGNRPYFFNNNLPKYPNYLNTSQDIASYGNNGKWNLPYKSSIVWPIRYVWEKGEAAINDGEKPEDFYAFLTVDSSSQEAFIEEFDVQMGAALADALFPVFDAYVKRKV